MSEPRNLVVCCDGTGNAVAGDLSNVLKLFRMLDKDAGQRVFYHPGVGTLGLERSWGRLRQDAELLLGLATGYGLEASMAAAYGFLCRSYREGDRIFLFGFSRGAYVVRAVAGLIHMLGLLRVEQLNLCGEALTAYTRASTRNDLSIAWQFRRVIGGRTVPIHFMGVWDTVASILVPRADRFYVPSMQFLPYTKKNPSVRAVRHALAIDERRRMFRPYGWTADQRHAATGEPQDQQEMWFAGVHADVGGGYPEEESGLAKIPLLWMVEEARRQGIRVDPAMLDQLTGGAGQGGDPQTYVPPDPAGPIHRSLRGAWWPLEVLPKNRRWRRWPTRTERPGWYLPRAEPRPIPDAAPLHPSVATRWSMVPGYRPANLSPERMRRELADHCPGVHQTAAPTRT